MTEFGGSIPADLQNSDPSVNDHGRELSQMCSDMVLCTCRTAADVPAAPSFKAKSITAPSRLDYFLVDPDLFPSIQSCHVEPARPDSVPARLKVDCIEKACDQKNCIRCSSLKTRSDGYGAQTC